MKEIIIKDFECDKCRFGKVFRNSKMSLGSRIRCNNKNSIYYFQPKMGRVVVGGCDDMELKLRYKN